MSTDNKIRFQFNTSRLYTAEGQVIIVEYNPDTKEADFHDYSRMISKRVYVGSIPNIIAKNERSIIRFIAQSVMTEYDNMRGEYTGVNEAPKRDAFEIVYLFRI